MYGEGLIFVLDGVLGFVAHIGIAVFYGAFEQKRARGASFYCLEEVNGVLIGLDRFDEGDAFGVGLLIDSLDFIKIVHRFSPL